MHTVQNCLTRYKIPLGVICVVLSANLNMLKQVQMMKKIVNKRYIYIYEDSLVASFKHHVFKACVSFCVVFQRMNERDRLATGFQVPFIEIIRIKFDSKF